MEKMSNGGSQQNGSSAVGTPAPSANGNGVEKPKKKRQRSPSYPAIDLEDALRRARVMYQHERRNAAALDVVVTHWGFKPKSSSGLLVAAAMKKFGLLVEVDGTKDRHVQLSPTALAVILDEQEVSPERDRLIREAAMRPEIHRELWARWGPELPSDATIRTYLVRDRDFTHAAADQFIEEYKRTISFARVAEADTIPNPGDDDQHDDSGEEVMDAGIPTTGNLGVKTNGGAAMPPPHKVASQPPAGMMQDTFSLDEGPVALSYPANLSDASLEDFKAWVEVALRKIERSIKRKSAALGEGD